MKRREAENAKAGKNDSIANVFERLFESGRDAISQNVTRTGGKRFVRMGN